MMVLSFDTHELIKSLRQSGFNEAQAEGLSSAFKETQESQIEGLATKHDLKELELEIDNKLSRLESKFDNQFSRLESEIKGFESEMKSEFKVIKWVLALIVAVTVLPVLRELFS